MGFTYYWALECDRCGKRVLKNGGPRGHGAMIGKCNPPEDYNHHEDVVLGPSGLRTAMAELGSYEEVYEVFVEEEDDERLLELAGED